tara:strand:+ start:198 stop:482 length:285 start_codon:yes stop_codon:yes gene_type:complete
MKKQSKFGKSWLSNKDNVNFPKWLTPEVIHTALFVHNAPSKEDIVKRVEHCSKLIGDESMQYAMALLVLPHLIDTTKDSQQYQEWIDDRSKSLN